MKKFSFHQAQPTKLKWNSSLAYELAFIHNGILFAAIWKILFFIHEKNSKRSWKKKEENHSNGRKKAEKNQSILSSRTRRSLKREKKNFSGKNKNAYFLLSLHLLTQYHLMKWIAFCRTCFLMISAIFTNRCRDDGVEQNNSPSPPVLSLCLLCIAIQMCRKIYFYPNNSDAFQANYVYSKMSHKAGARKQMFWWVDPHQGVYFPFQNNRRW